MVDSQEPVGARFRSLRDQVVDELREGIIEGRYRGGQRLVERDLSEDLQVSRITVREALQQLASEGLVEPLPRRGVVVTEVTEAHLRDLEEVRRSIEPLAARVAAERRTDEGLARLRGHLEDAAAAMAANDSHGATRANAAFHEEVVACTGNALLASLSSTIHGLILRAFFLSHQLATDATEDHEAIYRAIEAKDADLAARLSEDHVLTVGTGTIAAKSRAAQGGQDAAG